MVIKIFQTNLNLVWNLRLAKPKFFFPNQTGVGLENFTYFLGASFPNQTGFGLEKDTEWNVAAVQCLQGLTIILHFIDHNPGWHPPSQVWATQRWSSWSWFQYYMCQPVPADHIPQTLSGAYLSRTICSFFFLSFNTFPPSWPTPTPSATLDDCWSFTFLQLTNLVPKKLCLLFAFLGCRKLDPFTFPNFSQILQPDPYHKCLPQNLPFNVVLPKYWTLEEFWYC